MTTVAAVVNQITEQLSEAVSQLTLMVLKNKELNAPIPPHLPKAVEDVIKACSVLAVLAKQISSSEYSDYPKIQKKMNKAALLLEESNSGLAVSLKQLNTVERSEGWQKLLDACKVIAEKTTQLLQIVYGAALNRILECSQMTKEDLVGAKEAIYTVTKTPQALAHFASQSGSKVAQLAYYTKERAKEEESPITKQILLDCANDLELKSDSIISAANKVLSNPTDVALHKLFLDELQGAQDTIDKITNPLETQLNDPSNFANSLVVDDNEVLQTADNLGTFLPQLLTAAQKLQQNPNDESSQEGLKAILSEIQTEARSIALSSTLHPNGQSNPIKVKIDSIIAKILPIKGLNVDASGLLNSAQDLAGLMASLVAQTKTDIHKKNQIDNGGSGSKIGGNSELDQLLGMLDTHVKSNTAKPCSKQSIDALLGDLEKLTVATQVKPTTIKIPSSTISVNQSLDDIALSLTEKAQSKLKVSTPSNTYSKPIIEKCENVASELTKLANASKSSKASDLLIHSQQISKILSEITTQVNALLKEVKDPVMKEKLIRSAQALKNYSIQLKILASVTAASNPKGDNTMVVMASSIGKLLSDTMDVIKSAELSIKK